MTDGLLRQSDIEELTAWLDGELDGPAAERVARLVREDDAWRTTFEQFRAVDAAVELVGAPEPRRDLTHTILAAVAADRPSAWRAAIRIAGGMAAAAAILLAVYAATRDSGDPEPADEPVIAQTAIEKEIAQALDGVATDDQFIVQNLSLFQDYENVGRYEQVRDLADADTLVELAKLEAGQL